MLEIQRKMNLHIDKASLERIGIPIPEHSKLPDLVIYDESKNWLYLIEAVTSHGPMTPKRIVEKEVFLKACKAGKVCASAFPDLTELKRHTNEIAWDTEVWIMELPEHMIHFNGDFWGRDEDRVDRLASAFWLCLHYLWI